MHLSLRARRLLSYAVLVAITFAWFHTLGELVHWAAQQWLH